MGQISIGVLYSPPKLIIFEQAGRGNASKEGCILSPIQAVNLVLDRFQNSGRALREEGVLT